VEPAKARTAGSSARRGRYGPLAGGDLAWPQQGAHAQGHTILCIDASGFYPLPSVVRTYAPVGHTPMLRDWWTRDHLSAIRAISPEGKLYVHGQEQRIDSADVVAFLEHLRREVPGPLLLLWDRAPIHRTHLVTAFLAHSAAERIQIARLPAYAPELNPGEGLWAYLKGVELCHVCGCNLPHLRKELHAAVKRVRRKPRMIKGGFEGAKL
jgi:transposase